MKNRIDEWGFNFLLEWDDGQEMQVTLDGQYKDEIPWHQIHAENPDANNITLESIGRNY